MPLKSASGITRELESQVAFVTGGATGIGVAHARGPWRDRGDLRTQRGACR